MMKKIATIILPVISLIYTATSCSSDAADIENLGKGSELLFAVSELSRTSEQPAFNKFSVYGDIKLSTDKNTPTTVLFNNTEVEYKNDGWHYDGVQYWFPKHEHSFVAITPVSVLGTDAAPRYSNSILSFSYSAPFSADSELADNSHVADILAATHRRLYNTGDVNNTTTFMFTHIMSLINIAPAFYDNSMSSDAYILFHKLEFSGITTKARFDILPASLQSNNQTDDRVIDINGLEEGNFSIRFTTPVKVGNNAENVILFADNDAVITLPQNFEAESEAKITFFYTINDDLSINQVSFPLNTQKWESGKSYKYTFTIEKSGLKLDNCEINPWNVIKGEDITVD